MIIKQQKSQEVIIEGESNVKKATIDQTRIDKLQYLLTKGIYQDAISAVITEISNNAVDSIIEAGKDPILNPVIVEIYYEGNYKLSIKDNGIGMSKDFFENSFMSLLYSTKEESNDTIGFWGIGSKSWASLERPVNFIIIKDGVKCNYLCYKGEEFIEYDLIKEEITEEENGLLFQMNIEGYSEYLDFCKKAKKQLAYYDTVALLINGVLEENKIYRNDLFQFCEKSPYSIMHFTLKDVVYAINWDKLGISPINIPIAIKFGLEDGIVPTPSRENYLNSKKTITLIKSKIQEIANNFVDKYNSQIKDFSSFKVALPFINVDHKSIIIEGKTFSINELLPYKNKKCEGINVIGFNKEYLIHLKKRYLNLRDNYAYLAEIDYKNSFSTKKLFGNIYGDEKVLIVNNVPIGNFKEYLKEIYGRNTKFYKKRRERKLWNYNNGLCFNVESTQSDYYHVLNLKDIPKKDWRELIQMAQLIEKEFEKDFIDITNLEIPKQWLLDRKVKYQNSSNYNALNKTKGDITYYKPRNKEIGSGVIFEKNKMKISDLNKEKKMILYFPFENKVEALKLLPLFNNSKHTIWLFNPSEIKYLKGIHQFKNYKEFMTTPVFRKTATALLAKELIDNTSHIFNNNVFEPVIKLIADQYIKDIETIREYKSQFGLNNINFDLAKEIKEIAKEQNLYDLEMLSVINNVKKQLDKFSFVQYLTLPNISHYDSDEQKKEKNKSFKKMVYQILLFNKKYAEEYDYMDDYEQFDICIKPKELIKNELVSL